MTEEYVACPCEPVVDENHMTELEALCRPLIKYLNDNHHPHVKLTIHPTGYELMEGIVANGNIEDYILD